MSAYKVLLPVLIEGQYGQGDVFEHTFDSPADEAYSLDSGLLELQPATYKVVGQSVIYDPNGNAHQPGDTFEAAFRMGQEDHLTVAGHVERVEKEKPTEKEPAKKPAAKTAKQQ